MCPQTGSKQKRVLIVGASVLQLPAVLKAKQMGYCVGVVDYNPKAVAIPYADQYFNVSTIDIEGLTKVAKVFQPEGIVTLATDMPMRAIAVACKECGLPGISYETAIKTTDKAAMIKAFEEHGVSHPWYFTAADKTEFDSVLGKVTFPCIIKPTDNSGSRGVVLANDFQELKAAYAYSHKASRSGAVIMEEYLRGPEFSVEVIVVDGEPHVLQITDKLTTGAPHFVEMGHSQPTAQAKENRDQIRDLAIRACRAVGIENSPAHIEVILTENGPKMVEMGARMGGDCITTHLVPLSTGIDMVEAAINLACGREADITPKMNKGAAIRYFSTARGILKAVEGLEEARKIPGVREITFVKEPGDIIGDIESSVDRIGFVITQADTAEAAVRVCEKALSAVTVTIEEKRE